VKPQAEPGIGGSTRPNEARPAEARFPGTSIEAFARGAEHAAPVEQVVNQSDFAASATGG